MTRDFNEILDMAIKALEQQADLNKIRAEIENTMKYQYAIGENQYAEGFEKSLEIIDKCKSESEDSEE